MALSIRDTKKFGPLRLTGSKSGISVSVGLGDHLRLTRHPSGRWTRSINIAGWRNTRGI